MMLPLGQIAWSQQEPCFIPAWLGGDAHSLQDDFHLLGIV